MTAELTNLIAASVAFVGTHFVLSHPLRPGLVRALGEKGFLGLYSLVALATLAWMVWAFREVPPYGTQLWDGYDEVSWVLASLLTIVALVLLLGSFARNPALPGAMTSGLSTRTPRGVFRVTRHPMMWSFALWAIAHIAIAPTGRTLVLGLAILMLALVGAHLQDRKKAALLGVDWRAWRSRTHYWPRWRELLRAGGAPWLGAILLWLAITWAHIPLGYVPAGIWRWLV